MYIYQKRIQPKNTAAKITSALCLACGAILLIFAQSGYIALPILAQISGLALWVASIYIALSYLLRDYTYLIEIHDREEEYYKLSEIYDFVVYENKGKKSVKVCHIELKDVTLVREITPENKKDSPTDIKNFKRFVYNTQFAAGRKIEIQARISGEDYSVTVTYDEELFSILKKAHEDTSIIKRRYRPD